MIYLRIFMSISKFIKKKIIDMYFVINMLIFYLPSLLSSTGIKI